MASAEVKGKRDFRQDLTNEIARLVEEGVAPWQKPWHADQASAYLRLPHNASTGRAYRGGNSIYLMTKAQSLGSDDPRWCTFKQAEAEGWRIKKGSKGTTVEYWQFDKEEKHRDPTTGKEENRRVKLEIPRVFYATVFHASQVEGMPALAPIERLDGWDAVGEAERILAGSGARILHDQTDRAFYSSTLDQVHLPPKGAFDEALDYYEVALHELAHWSGHSSRLNRDLSGEFGSESYAREELRAQMASLYLSAELGVPFNPERHAAYQSSWVAALKADKNEIFRAARDAEIIADHIKDLARAKDREMAIPEHVAPSPADLPEPGKMLDSIEPIRRGNFEGAGRNEVQEAVAQAVEADPDKFIERFKALPQSFGGRFISADTFKATFEQYRESNEARNLFNTPVHNAAAVLASEQLRRVLQEPPKPGADTVILLTGIPGAGKTSSVLENGSLRPRIHAVYEGQLADPNVAIAKIQQVLDAGFKPVVVVVHSAPEKALDNTLLRFEEIGRGASINTMAKIQGGLPASLAAVHNEFGEAVELKVLDRRNYSAPQWVKNWQNLSLLESEGNHEHIKQRLEQHLESRRRQGLDADAYRQAAGLAPIVRERGRRIREGHDGQHDPAVDRRETSEGNRRNAGLSQPEAHPQGASPAPQPTTVQPLVRESDKVAAALDYISPDDRETWVRMAMAIENGLGDDGFDIWDRWSQRADNYRPLAAKAVWKSAKGGNGVGLGTLYWEAKQEGFNPAEWRTQETPARPDNSAERAAKLAAEAAQAEAKYLRNAAKAQAIFSQAQPANNTHPYLVKKGVDTPHFVDTLNPSAPREIWADQLEKVLGYAPKVDDIPLAGRILVIPVTNSSGISTLEFIDESGRKSALAGGKKSGAWYAPLAKLPSNPAIPTVVVEGVATAMSTHQGLNPLGQPIKAYVVAALSDTNLKNVANAMHALRPDAPVVVGADAISNLKSDPIQKAHDAAANVGGRFCYPEFPAGRLLNGKAPTDFNDLEAIFKEDGKSPADFQAAMAAILSGAHRAIPDKNWKEVIQPPSPAPSVQHPQPQETHMPDASTPKTPYAPKAIGSQIYKTTDLPTDLVNDIKERYGTRTTIATPKENGTYQGEIRDLKTHIVQEVSARSVVVHDKAQMGFKGGVEKANTESRLDGWDLKIYYDGQKPTAYPFDRQKEQFEIVVNSLKKSARESGKDALPGAIDELSKVTWQRIVEARKKGHASPAAPTPPAAATPAPAEPAKKPSKPKR